MFVAAGDCWFNGSTDGTPPDVVWCWGRYACVLGNVPQHSACFQTFALVQAFCGEQHDRNFLPNVMPQRSEEAHRTADHSFMYNSSY
jgi:hypothetical protein